MNNLKTVKNNKIIRRVIFIIFFLIIDVYIYFLFEPVFVWSYGWSRLPPLTNIPDDGFTYSEGYADEIKRAQDIAVKARQKLGSPAFSTAVGIDGELVWSYAVGYADLEELTPVAIDSVFRIGSTSKAVTSVAVSKLIYEKKLDIDIDIKSYIDYFPKKEYPITTRQLMSHMAGIRHYQLCHCFPVWEYYSNKNYTSVKDSISIFANDPLLYEPGSRFKYSSYGFNLISAIIESVSQKNFLTYMQENIFTPLGMESTSADTPDRANNLVKFYDIQNHQYKEVFPVDNSNKLAGGGFISTPSDLVKMGNAFLNKQFLDQRTLDMMLTPQTLNNGKINKDSYALGWRSHASTTILADGRLTSVAHHGGVAQGSLSFLLLLPEYNIVVSVLANRSLTGVFPLAEYGFSLARVFVKNKVPENTDKTKKYAGRHIN